MSSEGLFKKLRVPAVASLAMAAAACEPAGIKGMCDSSITEEQQVLNIRDHIYGPKGDIRTPLRRVPIGLELAMTLNDADCSFEVIEATRERYDRNPGIRHALETAEPELRRMRRHP